jgi:Tfp pilus assembly protein PilV
MYRKLIRKARSGGRWTNKGFTLTEVIVASTLLILGIVPILKALTTAHVNAAVIEHRTHSLILAQYKLDEIKARSIYNYGSSFAQSSASLGGSYLASVVDTTVGSNLRKITVSVGYDQNSNSILEEEEIEVTLATLVARRW